MPVPAEIIAAMDAVLEVTHQPEDFKSRLRALVANMSEGGFEDRDVAGLVGSIDIDSDTGG